MKRALLIIFLGLTLSISVLAQAAPEKPATKAAEGGADVSVDQVLDKYISALGGKDALMKVKSRSAKGTFEIAAMGLSAPAEIYAKAPNSVVLIINVPGLGTIQQGYNGSTGWSQDPQTGLRDITGAELASIKREAEFYR